MIIFPPYETLLAATPMREGDVTVLGSATRYWEYGPEDAAVTVVIVHGFRGEHHGLEPVIAHIQGVRMIAPDLPGFGESTPMTEAAHDVAGYAGWLEKFVAALGVAGTAVILGHSFGSIITANAIAAGVQTPRLILINPIADSALTGPKAFLTWLTVGYYRVGAALPKALGKRVLSNPIVVRFMSIMMAKTRNRELRRWIHDQHDTYFSRFSDAGTLVEAFGASISGSVGAVADRIRVPTLLIGGDQDPITRVSSVERLAASLPDARLHLLENVGHLIHYERPREAATAIVDFLGAGRIAAAQQSGPPL